MAGNPSFYRSILFLIEMQCVPLIYIFSISSFLPVLLFLFLLFFFLFDEVENCIFILLFFEKGGVPTKHARVWRMLPGRVLWTCPVGGEILEEYTVVLYY